MSESESLRELLRSEEAAQVFGVGRSKVFEMLRAGELPVIRMGRSVRIPRRALATWMEERTELLRSAAPLPWGNPRMTR